MDIGHWCPCGCEMRWDEATFQWVCPHCQEDGMRHPVDAAYTEALHIACTNCAALPGEHCINRQTGKPSKIPCMARLKDADTQSKIPIEQLL